MKIKLHFPVLLLKLIRMFNIVCLVRSVPTHEDRDKLCLVCWLYHAYMLMSVHTSLEI